MTLTQAERVCLAPRRMPTASAQGLSPSQGTWNAKDPSSPFQGTLKTRLTEAFPMLLANLMRRHAAETCQKWIHAPACDVPQMLLFLPCILVSHFFVSSIFAASSASFADWPVPAA